jgi:predicted nuclease of predicted toxin-antitoxin system
VHAFTLAGKPALLLVSTGNIANSDLMLLLERDLPAIARAFVDHRFVELRRDALYLHR